MSQLKRFIKWCIDNDFAFTNIDNAIKSWREDENDLELATRTKEKYERDGISVFKEYDRLEPVSPYWCCLTDNSTGDTRKHWVLY